jgi:hypothetical protein
MENNTTVISFRIHPNTRTWLRAASDELSGHIPALLRMMFLSAAWTQQDSPGGLLGKLFGDGNRRQRTIGNTLVVSVRLSIEEANTIKAAAASKNMGVSEWAVNTIEGWFPTFKPAYDAREQDPVGWLTDWTSQYLQKFSEIQDVYARSRTSETEKEEVGRGS